MHYAAGQKFVLYEGRFVSDLG